MKNGVAGDIIRLSIIDDHPVVFLGVQMSLRRCKTHSIEIVNQYTNGDQILNDLPNLNSNVLLIDLCLPDIKGYDLASKILEVYPEMKIGIYSSMNDRELVLKSFRSGALGYLSKTATADMLIDFILTISKGERYIRGTIADIVFSDVSVSNKQFNITKRENEIMQLIFDGLKNREIAEKLNIAERTVEFHKQNIYLKLEVNNSVDLYKSAQRFNLLSENQLYHL